MALTRIKKQRKPKLPRVPIVAQPTKVREDKRLRPRSKTKADLIRDIALNED